MANQDRYDRMLEAIDWERKTEESYFKQLQSKKTNAEKIEAGILWYPVVIVKKYYTIGEQVEIIVERKIRDVMSHRFKTGMGCQVFTVNSSGEKESLKGVVSFVKKLKMGILFGSNVNQLEDIEDRFKSGVELVYDEKPYTVMTQAIHRVKESQEDHISELRTGISKQSDFAPYQPQTQQFHPWTSLNDSQNAAIAGCLSAERIAIIHGPPGTGKTTTLVALIKETLRSQKRILVCAPSNNAVDLLARRLEEAGVDTLRVGNVSRVADSTAHLTLANKVANHDDWKHIKKVKIEANEARKQAGSFKRKFGYKERENRNAMYKESRELKKWARELEDRLVDSILNKAQAVCSTLMSASSSYIKDLKFETVVIDEASQALEPECWNAILKAKRVIFAGDHLQLPPTVKSREAEELGLTDTILDRMSDKIHHSYLLTTQYRMNDKILSFSNKRFYESKLVSDVSNSQWSLDDHPLVFIDTSGCGFEEEKHSDTFSSFNKGEIFIIREWFLQHRDILQEDTAIGIISPYAAQVKLLKQHIEDEETYRGLNIEVNSIDGFQGQEKDLILISLVRSNENGEIGFLADERRLNVGMTRAKKKLVIIGDLSTLGGSELYTALADHIESDGHYQSAWEYMS